MKSNLAHEMEHKLPKVVGFRFAAGAPYTLHINFNDGVDSKVDFQDVLEGELYGALKDPSLFRQVKLEEGNLVWPNGADFDPEILHDWPERKEAMVAAAARWRRHSPGYRGAIFYLAWYVLIGFVAGFITWSVLHTQKGFLETTVLGIVGSILGGLIARKFSAFSERAARHERVTVAYASLIGALLVSFVVVSLWR